MTDQHNGKDQPLDRTFAVLEAVVAAERPLSVSDISTVLALPAATVHRLVAQLLDRELLKREFHTKRVLAGPRLVEFGANILEAAVQADRPRAILLNLATRLGEHCQVGIVSENEVLYVSTARADRTIGLQFEPGRRAPLHCTSIGKLYLASLRPQSFASWLTTAPLQPFTANTLTDPASLRAEIEIVRHRGWSESHEEYVEGVSGCAVPIRKNGRFVAGLGIAAPAIRLNASRMQEVLPHLTKASGAITAALYGRSQSGSQ